MPNGKPGDHPYTDIVHHGSNIYGSGIDDLVREIAAQGPDASRRVASDLLWESNPWFGEKPDIAVLRQKLEALRSNGK